MKRYSKEQENLLKSINISENIYRRLNIAADLVSKLNTSAILSEQDVMNTLKPFEQLQKSVNELINSSLKQLISSVDLFSQNIWSNLQPIYEILDNQKRILEQARFIESFELPKINSWHSTIERMINSSTLSINSEIPDSIYAPLDELTTEIEELVPSFDDSQTSTEITKPANQVSENLLTWIQLIGFLILVWQLILDLQSNHVNNIQHMEIMSELQKQTEIEQQQITVNKELLETQQELLQIEQERNEREKLLEEKYDLLLQHIEPLIESDQGVHDNDQ